MHLILPLLASLLFVCGLIVIKRAGAAGVSSVTTVFCTNVAAAFAFSFVWFMGGDGVRWELWWQPLIIAKLFVFGLGFTFVAIERGDVSLATPIFGVRVVFVALLLTATGEQDCLAGVVGGRLATLGIGLIQWTGEGNRHHVILTVCLSLAAAVCYATLTFLFSDGLHLGAGRFLPHVYWIRALPLCCSCRGSISGHAESQGWPAYCWQEVGDSNAGDGIVGLWVYLRCPSECGLRLRGLWESSWPGLLHVNGVERKQSTHGRRCYSELPVQAF